MSILSSQNQPVSAPEQTDWHFRVVADSMQDLAWIAHPDGFIYWFNHSWYTYTGTTPEQMEGWGWQTVHDPVSLPAFMTKWQASIDSAQPFDMVFPLKGADGIFRPFLTRAIPGKDSAGKVLHWFGTNTDISREVEATTALRLSEARFRTATQAVNAILWTNDAAGKMSGPQPGWSTFTGQSEPEYRGYGWSAAVHPDDAGPTLQAWEIAVKERRLFAFEHRVRRHDGVFRLCSIRALPVLDDAGHVIEWVGVHTDITEEQETRSALHQTVTALQEQQEILEVAQMVGQVGYWRLRPSIPELFLSSGSRHLLSLPLTGEITVEQALSSIDPSDRSTVEAALENALITGEYLVEFRTNVAQAEQLDLAGALGQQPQVPPQRWIRSIGRVFAAQSDSPYLVGKVVDITHEKRSAAALIQAEKLAVAGRLAASIAHEINNPLEAITNLAYLLAHSPLDPESAQLVESLQSELRRVSHITTHTLRFHRQSTRDSLVDIAGLIESVLALYEGRLRNYNIRVHSRLCATRKITAFDGDLRQVLANLVGNAIDAMQAAPEPRILFLRSADALHPATRKPGIRITIADTGTGIATAHLRHIFEPFFTTKPETGTGLGLWISHEIIAKHNGSLRLRSCQDPALHGTAFHLFLPTH